MRKIKQWWSWGPFHLDLLILLKEVNKSLLLSVWLPLLIDQGKTGSFLCQMSAENKAVDKVKFFSGRSTLRGARETFRAEGWIICRSWRVPQGTMSVRLMCLQKRQWIPWGSPAKYHCIVYVPLYSHSSRPCFSSVQFSRSIISNSLWPHEWQHARPPCPSQALGVYSNSCPSSQWCHPTISSSVVPFSSCPQSLPASGSFPMSQLFPWGGQSTGVSSSASVLPMNTQGWSPLGWTGWISL